MATLTAKNIRKRLGLDTDNAMISGVTFTPAAGTANVCNVVIRLQTAAGQTIAEPRTYDVYLSDAATGAGLTAVTASGTVTNASAAGTVVGTNTAKKALRVQALATGLFTLEITDTAKTGFYVCVVDPATGKPYVSAQLVTANFG